MAPLSASLECPSAEELQTSCEVNKHAKLRRCDWYLDAKLRRCDWYLGTWNVRSLVDNEGSDEF